MTVVVDYHQLGGGVQQACDADGGGKVASTVFPDSGFPLTYVQRQPGFVCRVAGAPSSDPCVNTPPASAYWSLWWSDGKSGTWTYASTGVGSLKVPDGGYVAFSWQGQDGKAAPGVTPSPRAASSSPSPSPSAGDSGGGDGATGGASGGGATAARWLGRNRHPVGRQHHAVAERRPLRAGRVRRSGRGTHPGREAREGRPRRTRRRPRRRASRTRRAAPSPRTRRRAVAPARPRGSRATTGAGCRSG